MVRTEIMGWTELLELSSTEGWWSNRDDYIVLRTNGSVPTSVSLSWLSKEMSKHTDRSCGKSVPKEQHGPLIEAADVAHTGGGLPQRTSSRLYKIPSHRRQDEEREEFLRKSWHDGAELGRACVAQTGRILVEH